MSRVSIRFAVLRRSSPPRKGGGGGGRVGACAQDSRFFSQTCWPEPRGVGVSFAALALDNMG